VACASVQFDGAAQDYFAGLDDSTGSFMLGSGFTVQAGSAYLTMTSAGLFTLTGSALTTSNLLTMNTAGLTTGYAETINANGAAVLTTGGAIDINGPTGAAVMDATTGLLNISSTGAITNSTTGAGSGSLFQVTGNGTITATLASISDTSVMTTTGKLLDLTANAATTPSRDKHAGTARHCTEVHPWKASRKVQRFLRQRSDSIGRLLRIFTTF
jgi:hypothetical protein